MDDTAFFSLMRISNYIDCLGLGITPSTDLRHDIRSLAEADKDLCLAVLLAVRDSIEENPRQALQKFKEVQVPGTEKVVGDFLTVNEGVRRLSEP